MEIVQYICTFFFDNFKHFLGLLILLLIIKPFHVCENNYYANQKEEKDERKDT